MRRRYRDCLLLAAAALLCAYAFTYAPAALRPALAAARATTIPPAQAETLPACSPAPVLIGQTDVWSADRKSVQSEAVFRAEVGNAPCYFDVYFRATNDRGASSVDVKRYYFMPLSTPTPTATPTPESTPVGTPTPVATPTPVVSPTPTPSPKPCPPGQKNKPNGKC
jgi:hypothetical protein